MSPAPDVCPDVQTRDHGRCLRYPARSPLIHQRACTRPQKSSGLQEEHEQLTSPSPSSACTHRTPKASTGTTGSSRYASSRFPDGLNQQIIICQEQRRTNIENHNTTFTLVGDKELLEGDVRRLLRSGQDTRTDFTHRHLRTNLVRCDGVALPNVVGVPQSSHVDSMRGHFQQRSD